MTAGDDIRPERLEELLDGAPPRDDAEREALALLAEIRALDPPASPALHARVAAMVDEARPAGTPWKTRLRALLPGGNTSRRRWLSVAAPLAAAVLAAAVIVPTALRDGGSDGDAPVAALSRGPVDDAERSATAAAEAAPAPAAPSGTGAAVPPDAGVPAAEPARAQQVTAWTRVQVADVAALSEASTQAMEIARSLGGHTASSDYDVPDGDRGDNRLVFRVPAGQVDNAIAEFGRLGTVIGQDAQIVDVTDRITAGTDAIAAQRARVRTLRAQSVAEPGDAAVARRLAAAERRLATLTARRDAVADRAAMAVVRLELTTQSPPAPPTDRGRIVAALADSWDRLTGVTAWTLGALVLMAPFVVLALLAAWGAARGRRAAGRRPLRM